MSLQKMNKKKPLVHCSTNYVVENFIANGLLAIGASQEMTDIQKEVTEINYLELVVEGRK